MLEADGKPVLLLLDEVLKYMERAAAVGVKDSTLQRQAKDFIQNLTVEVSNSTNAVMVYSLQWSAREALGNVALLEELDKLTSRKDQVREPVTGDEVLAVVKRRLLGDEPSGRGRDRGRRRIRRCRGRILAGAGRDAVGQTGRRRADDSIQEPHAGGLSVPSGADRRDEQPLDQRGWVPAHPRRLAVPGVVPARAQSAWRRQADARPCGDPGGRRRGVAGDAQGPGPRQDYAPVFTHDLVGPNARAKRIDDRLAKETPALANVRPALRLATAILAYSFGGLKREAKAAKCCRRA